MKTVRCMGVDGHVWNMVGFQGFSVVRYPFEATADERPGKWTWVLSYYGHLGRIAEGEATSMEECVAAIEAARHDALRDLREQLREAEGEPHT